MLLCSSLTTESESKHDIILELSLNDKIEFLIVYFCMSLKRVGLDLYTRQLPTSLLYYKLPGFESQPYQQQPAPAENCG